MSIDIIIEEENEVLTLVVEDGLSPLSVSSDVDNILSLQPDGLYAPDTSIDKVDKEVGKSLVDDLEIAKLLYIEAEATKNDTDESLRDRGTHTGEQPISSITNLSSELNSKVDKEVGKSLLSNTEIVRLSLIEDEATKNRPDTENADKVHSHIIGDVTGLQNSLDGKVDKVVGESLIPDTELIRLATVATDATKNATDVSLRDRSTHTGSQPINTVEGLTDALDSKVDKVVGKNLTDENFTEAEKAKLAGLESSRFKGAYSSLASLQSGVVSPQAGDYADVDNVGADVVRYIYDVTDSKWVVQQSATSITSAQIKQMYESNPDTNSYSDDDKSVVSGVTAVLSTKVDKVTGKQLSDENYTLAEKQKLGGIADEATKNRADSENADKVHSHAVSDVTGLSAALLTKFDKTDVVQATGQSTEKVMSQKAVTDELDAINLLIGDTSAALDAINGEVI